MRDQLIDDLFRHVEAQGKLVMGSPSPEESDAFESLPLPLELKRLLQWHWPIQSGEVGSYNLYGVRDVLNDEDLMPLIEANMVPIGYAINGDPLVIKFSENDHEVGLISHDEYWEDRPGGPERCYVPIARSLDEMLWKAVEGRFLPIDFYSASELNDLKTESA